MTGTKRAAGGRCEEERPHHLWVQLCPPPPDPASVAVGSTGPPGSFKWQPEGRPRISPDSQCEGTEKPELTFQRGRKHLPGARSCRRPGPTFHPHHVHVFTCSLVSSSLSFPPVSGPFPLSKDWVSSLPSPSEPRKVRPSSLFFKPLPSPRAPLTFILEDLSLATAYLLQTFTLFSKVAPTSPPTPKVLICSRIQNNL